MSFQTEDQDAATQNVRTPRSASSREAKGRISKERPPIVFGAGSRFNLPESVVKKIREDGQEPGFVVYSSGNTEQRENYDNAVERGWKPIQKCDYPELSRQSELSPFGKREEDQLIRRGGQIAMVRDSEIHEAEQDYYDSEKQRQQYMADMYKQSDPRYPKPFMDERTRNRAR